MNNRQLISALAQTNQLNRQRTQELLQQTVSMILEALGEGQSVNITNFGLLEVKKHNERITVNPTTKQRTLVPPRLVLNFKPATRLKTNVKHTQHG